MRTEAGCRLPPCTTRWPTASTPSRPRTAPSSSASSKRPPTALNSCSATVESSSTRLTFSDDEPALTTSTLKRLIRPHPVQDVGWVLAVVARVLAVAQALVVHPLTDVRGLRPESGHAVDHVHDQVEPVEVVEHDHVEGRGRGALLFVTADMDVVVVSAPVREAVDQPRVTVVGEDHRPVGREQCVELRVGHPVRVLAWRLQAHEVDDVHDPHFQVR